VLEFRAMTLDTGEAIVNVGGNVNLSKEAIDLGLKTESKHFSIGSLPGRLNIGGTFKDPTIRPGAEETGRLGAAAGLAIVFAPLAILPTIQFGTSDNEDARCGQLLEQARASAGGKALPAQAAPPAR
jgi:AsmA family protein